MTLDCFFQFFSPLKIQLPNQLIDFLFYLTTGRSGIMPSILPYNCSAQNIDFLGYHLFRLVTTKSLLLWELRGYNFFSLKPHCSKHNFTVKVAGHYGPSIYDFYAHLCCQRELKKYILGIKKFRNFVLHERFSIHGKQSGGFYGFLQHHKLICP